MPTNHLRVHRNLHNAKRGGPQWVSTVRGKVDAYLDDVLLTGVTTRIQPAGARKCAESGVRSVCAYFDGDKPTGAYVGTGEWHRVAYDPRVDAAFQFLAHVPGEADLQPRPWNAADAAALRADGSTWVLNPRWENRS